MTLAMRRREKVRKRMESVRKRERERGGKVSLSK